MPKKRIGLLIMAYGTPRNTEEIEPYYTHIRRGRKPSPEQLQDLIARYEAIGGISPLARITEAQAEALEKRCNQLHPDITFKSYLGYRHIDPFIEDAVTAMHKDGIQEAVSLVLAPHYSTFSVQAYNGRAQKQARELDSLTINTVDSWHDEPKFIDYWAHQVEKALATLSAEDKEKAVVIFSAHSLPERILQSKDPYPQQLEETAALIAKKARVPHYAIGWQSEGNTPEPWIGPDVQDLTRDLYEKEGYTTYIYCPVGFVSDHLEVLYDNDVECKEVTDELGVRYLRPAMPNDDPLFIDALADVVTKRLQKEM